MNAVRPAGLNKRRGFRCTITTNSTSINYFAVALCIIQKVLLVISNLTGIDIESNVPHFVLLHSDNVRTAAGLQVDTEHGVRSYLYLFYYNVHACNGFGYGSHLIRRSSVRVNKDEV
jgi:hypothetical protein